MLPSRSALRAWGTENDFEVRDQLTVTQEIDSNLHEYVARIGRRGSSDLASISDLDFERGMQKLRLHCENMKSNAPITESIDLFVFGAATFINRD